LLHASYAQRTERCERRASEEIADYYRVREPLAILLNAFAQIGGSGLTDPPIAVPMSDEALAPHASIPVTYVPFHNAHFLSAAISWAEVTDATAIFIGAVAEDSSGYPDCRPEYYHAFAEPYPQRDTSGDAY
jgi:7-cyano-7-deazaguanine synthase